MQLTGGMSPLAADDPRSVGDFRLHHRLGAGGMGRVFLGFSPAGRAVAVKLVYPDLARDHAFRQRFRREVAAARAVNGMYTAPVVEAGVDDAIPWLATAFVPGPSLADAVAGRGALPESAVWKLAGGLVEALTAIHGCNVVHRDLKPANVLLAADGPRVIDFGISKALDGSALTTAGTVVGTPAFMSPEQAQGLLAGEASDVFSLGSVLAFAATGYGPFGDGSPSTVLYRVVYEPPVLGGVSAALGKLMIWCLAKEPARRPTLPQLMRVIATSPAASEDKSAASFWPEPLNDLIRAYQASLDNLAQSGARTVTARSVVPAREPPPRAAAGRPRHGGRGAKRPARRWHRRALSVFAALLLAGAGLTSYALLQGSAPAKTRDSGSTATPVLLGRPDFAGFCLKTGQGKVSLMRNLGAYGWRCTADDGRGDNAQAVCAWTYKISLGRVIDSIQNFNDPYAWQCWEITRPVKKPNFQGYCTAHGFGNAYVNPQNPTADGWLCTNDVPDVLVVCEWTNGASFLVDRFQDFYDPHSWQCWE